MHDFERIAPTTDWDDKKDKAGPGVPEIPEIEASDAEPETAERTATPLEQTMIDLQLAVHHAREAENATKTLGSADSQKALVDARAGLEDVAGRYVELNLVEMAEDPSVNQLLREKGVIDSTGSWDLESSAVQHLTEQFTAQAPTRMDWFADSDAARIQRGIRNSLRDWLGRYQKPFDVLRGKRPQPPEAMAA